MCAAPNPLPGQAWRQKGWRRVGGKSDKLIGRTRIRRRQGMRSKKGDYYISFLRVAISHQCRFGWRSVNIGRGGVTGGLVIIGRVGQWLGRLSGRDPSTLLPTRSDPGERARTASWNVEQTKSPGSWLAPQTPHPGDWIGRPKSCNSRAWLPRWRR